MTVQIGTKSVGPGHPVYVIAEIGGNHDGDLMQAVRLIHEAAQAGADAAKFQFFNPDTLYPGQHTPGAIGPDWLKPLQTACRAEGIEFLCSVFDLETLHTYFEIQPAAIKIASPEACNGELVRAAAATNRPVILSTGAMTWAEVDRAHDWLFGIPTILLHCVSAYPAALADMNLRVISGMASRYQVPVGLSDHTLGYAAAKLAIAQGASVIEKHLTLDRNLAGLDHSFALEPDEFAQLVDIVRLTEERLGDGVKRVQPSEDPTDRR